MDTLVPLAEKIAARLIAHKETIAVAESSTGGLVSAALLALPGASAYFVGGAVVYTKAARAALMGVGDADMQDLRPSTEAYALMLAKRARERMGATWGIAETGATGPTGNRYGDAAGHTCIAVSGPVERAITLETGSADRRANMDAFAKRALELLSEVISAARYARLLRRLGHLGAHLRAECVDRFQALRRLDVPEGPDVAGVQPLRQRADAVDRADAVAEGECAVGAD